MKRSVQDESEDPQGRPLKVPKRKGPTPVLRAPNEAGSGPASPTVPRSSAEKIWAVAARLKNWQYSYSPITENQIRLLRISSGQPEDDIIVTMKTVDFKDLGSSDQYEALSYYWGAGEADFPVYVRDAQSPASVSNLANVVLLAMKKVFVKPNLDKALRCLRQKDSDMMLWVDALCINQEDDNEKKIQVSKMAQIYNMAERVCIWLGAGNKRSENVMKFIDIIIDLKSLKDVTQDERFIAQWNDLLELMRSSWFSRRWVIQELAFAKDATVHYGNEEVNWNDFKDAVGLFVRHFDTIRNLFRHSKSFGHNYHAIRELDPLGAKVLTDVTSNIFRKNASGNIFEPILGLETLVSSLSTFEASDPRDTIHALRNICKEVPWKSTPKEAHAVRKVPPEVDYSKDLLEVYTDFVRWVIDTTGSLDIICRHWALPEKEIKAPYKYPELVSLPSWIQEISESPYGRQTKGAHTRKNGDSFVGTPNQRCYDASHGKVADVRFAVLRPNNASTSSGQAQPDSANRAAGSAEIKKKRDPSLYVKGFLIDTITWVSDAIADGVITHRCLQKGGWSGVRKEKVERAPDKLWRTLVADRGADGRNPPNLYHRACLHCLVKDTPNGHINTLQLLEEIEEDITKDYLKRVQAVTWNRAFLEADSQQPGAEKLFGVGPPETELKDVICILFGCSVPCILREHPHPEGGTYFELIGEAFVYGKMDGEAVTALSEEALREQTREFRLM